MMTQPHIERCYPYHDASGSLKYETVRYNPKDFRQRQCDGHGGHTWSMSGVERVPYKLPLLLEKKAEKVVFYVEGEKDADALCGLGLVATTNAGGAAWQLTPVFVECFCGAKAIALIPDCDQPGRKAARERAERFAEVCADVRILDLDETRDDGYDISDWLSDGGTLKKLRDLFDATPPLAPPTAAGASEQWPNLLDIDPVPHPQSLDPKLVPAAYRPFVEDAAERLCVPLEFVAVPLMSATAAVVGRKVLIQPEPRNTWREAPNLWGALVADPGMLKSPAQAAAFASLRRLAAEKRKDFEAKSVELKVRQQLAKLKVETLEQAYRQAHKAGSSTTEIEADLQAQREIIEERVVERRYFTHDATVAKLGELLRDNPEGLLTIRDELTGTLRTMDTPGHEADRAFHLEGWNGQSPFTADRIGRGTIHIPAHCLMNFGTIQPGPLREFVADAISGGSGADGLIQRFGLLVVCLKPPPWKRCDRPEDQGARVRVDAVFDGLDSIKFAFDGESNVLTFAPDAQPIFDEWRADLENRIRSESESPAFRAWLAKQRKTVPGLALLFHLVDGAESGDMLQPVSRRALLAACGWGAVLESHARHLFVGAVATPAMMLAARIRRGDLADETSVRNLKRRSWSGLSKASDVDAALDELADHAWLRLEDRDTGGRRSQVIRLHPDLRRSQ